MFYIDGTQWPYPCDIVRTAEVRSSEVSGLMMDGSYYNDVLGTFLEYTIKIAVPMNARDAYTALYEKLTDPIDAHTVILPYNQGTVNIAGRVGSVSDVYVRLPNGGMAWKGIQFTVTANHATKAITQQEAITRGRTVMPEMADHNEGDQWTWTNGRWVLTASYRNADTTRY